jgi:hypothetical protein
MPHPRRLPAQDLRTAIDCLPLDTRLAMLDGVRSHDIIVGAYTDRSGGVCPMLAAHRCGGRTDFLSFARAWDRFSHAKRTRRATERELRVLTSHLEASVLADDALAADFKAAIADHQGLLARRPPRDAAAEPGPPAKVRPGDPDRSHELKGRHGWSWLRPFRRLDEYERALALIEEQVDRDARDERELV